MILLTTLGAFAQLGFDLGNQPLNDLPNHTARGLVIADLLFHGGKVFGNHFTLSLALEPYILGDLLLAILAELLPACVGQVTMALCFFSLPAAAWFFARCLRLPPWSCGAFAIAATFVATDFTFVLGFVQFRLSLPLLLLALGFAWQLLQRATAGAAVGYAICVVAGYLMHLAMPVLLVPALIALLLLPVIEQPRERRRALLSMAAGLLTLPALLVSLGTWLSTPILAGATIRLPLEQKLQAALRVLSHFDTHLAWLLCIFPVVVVVARAWQDRSAQLMVLVAASFGIAFMVLPAGQGTTWWIDARAVPLAYLFTVFAGIAATEVRSGVCWLKPVVTGLLGAISLANLLSISGPLSIMDRDNATVREVLHALPEGAAVLPIVSRAALERLQLHTAEFAIGDRHAFTPYLFSGDQQLPQRHFRYRARPYAPSEDWAIRSLPVEWSRIRETWPFLLVVGRLEDVSIPNDTQVMRANAMATLLRFDH